MNKIKDYIIALCLMLPVSVLIKAFIYKGIYMIAITEIVEKYFSYSMPNVDLKAFILIVFIEMFFRKKSQEKKHNEIDLEVVGIWLSNLITMIVYFLFICAASYILL